MSHYTGDEGVLGWSGWIADLANPASDYKDACETAEEMVIVVTEFGEMVRDDTVANMTLRKYRNSEYIEEVRAYQRTQKTPQSPGAKRRAADHEAKEEKERQEREERSFVGNWWASFKNAFITPIFGE